MAAWAAAVILTASSVSASNPTHYGDPRTGCLADEHNVTITGVAGDLCSPDCHPKSSPACPTDVPSGVTAQPQCELTYQSGGKGCVLTCSPTVDAAALRAGDSACGAGSCQPIQGVGVCTYGAPPPSGLPNGCVAGTTANGDTAVSCSGNTSPEPGCANINTLCCASQLPDTFARLMAYRAKHPFSAFSFSCSGNFGGGNATWAARFGSLMRPITGLSQLHLDLSYNIKASDAVIAAVEPALQANSGTLRNVSIIIEGSNLSDVAAIRLGKVIAENYKGPVLSVDVSRNDPGDIDGAATAITATGAGGLASAIGSLQGLKILTLNFGYDSNVTAVAVSRIANGLAALRNVLEYLNLGLGYIDIMPGVPANDKPNRYYSCLAKTIGAFTKLKTLVLDLDTDIPDATVVQDLGIHLACLPIPSMSLPGMDNDQTACHCGLAVDKAKGCLIPNKNYAADLGDACFACMASANATVCS